MPFELTETGWGEFEIGVVLHFAPDSQEKDLELFHRLKLYSDDDPTGGQLHLVPCLGWVRWCLLVCVGGGARGGEEIWAILVAEGGGAVLSCRDSVLAAAMAATPAN